MLKASKIGHLYVKSEMYINPVCTLRDGLVYWHPSPATPDRAIPNRWCTSTKMRTSKLFAAVAVIELAAAGFATYTEIRSGADNSDAITYYELDRSDTLFLYIQIIAGGNHQPLIEDFKTLARNYGGQGVSAIPRVRYGSADGSVASEPEDAALILDDVATWATAFSEVAGIIEMPVIQAGFLGMWGEWHVSTYVLLLYFLS